ncbi:hypothetical protein [Parafrankia sp. FMc2]|uniref:hypothetical protein n=1 Tax=Parafrankia sp. FMc2 TaxID=3233196 RepID=UPI0034D449BE
MDYTLSGSENYFAHEQWSEPQLLPEVGDRDPRRWKLLTTPAFLFLAARLG